jgi:hypothetical protein
MSFMMLNLYTCNHPNPTTKTDSPPVYLPSGTERSLCPRTSIPDLCWLLERRANRAKLDVRKHYLRIGVIGLDISRHTARDIALSTCRARRLWVAISRVGRVKPEHISIVIVPKRHDEDHAETHTLAHGRHAAELVEGVNLLVEDLLLGVAPLLGNGVAGHAGDGGLGVGKDGAALDVEALELGEGGAGAEELGHDGHFLGGVDALAFAVEVFDADAVGVDWWGDDALVCVHVVVAIVWDERETYSHIRLHRMCRRSGRGSMYHRRYRPRRRSSLQVGKSEGSERWRQSWLPRRPSRH